MVDKINYNDFTLLLADDDLEFIQDKATRLEQLGFTVFCADCGEKAIEIAKTKKIHIAIIDFFSKIPFASKIFIL